MLARLLYKKNFDAVQLFWMILTSYMAKGQI